MNKLNPMCVKHLFFLTFIFSSAPVWASDIVPPLLNKISYQLSEEQWASTSTVKVTVSVDITLNEGHLEAISQQVMEKLKKISEKSGWNIVQFDRSQDNSGLERLHIEAQARLPESELARLRDRAKNVSRPGEAYKVGALEFVPTLAELEKTHTELRSRIYDRVKSEVSRLNQVDPTQRYFIHMIDFNPTLPSPLIPAMTMESMAAGRAINDRKSFNQLPMMKNTKIVETANIVIASEMLLHSSK